MDTADETTEDAVYVRVVNDSAQSMVRVINESIEIINKTNDPETKWSRLGVVEDKIQQLEELQEQHPLFDIKVSGDIKFELEQLRRELKIQHLEEVVEGNLLGRELEKEGQIEKASHVYESLVNLNVDTPFPYRRLAIIYKKMKRKEDEVRVLEAALENIPVTNKKHYQWFQDRLAKFEV